MLHHRSSGTLQWELDHCAPQKHAEALDVSWLRMSSGPVQGPASHKPKFAINWWLDLVGRRDKDYWCSALTAPVVATIAAARSSTTTSQPAFRSATAVLTPPTLPPITTTFIGMIIRSVDGQDFSPVPTSDRRCFGTSPTYKRVKCDGGCEWWYRTPHERGLARHCKGHAAPSQATRRHSTALQSYNVRQSCLLSLRLVHFTQQTTPRCA